MKIAYLLVFTVLSLCNRESVTLPIKEMGEIIFKPTRPIESVNVITINGTMKILNNLLSVAFVDKQKNTLCMMTYDTTTNTATVTSELAQPNTFQYNLDNPDPTKPIGFSLQIEPEKPNKQHLIILHFEANNAGPLAFEPCEVKNMKNIHRIVVIGSETISSMSYEFKK